jgi:hypothetical protein
MAGLRWQQARMTRRGRSQRRSKMSRGMREAEPLRISELARQVPGKWVAVRDHEVIDVADSLDALVTALAVRCISDVSVLRIPAEGESELVGLG